MSSTEKVNNIRINNRRENDRQTFGNILLTSEKDKESKMLKSYRMIFHDKSGKADKKEQKVFVKIY